MHFLFNDPPLEKAVQQAKAIQLNVAEIYDDLVFYFLAAQLACVGFIILPFLPKILKITFKVLMFLLAVLIIFVIPRVILEFLKHGSIY